MTNGRRPPRLLVKTLAVTFLTVALLLVIVFVFVTLTMRGQVRQSVAANLESSQRMFAALETRRQREMQMQASALAENPTLKAAPIKPNRGDRATNRFVATCSRRSTTS